MDEINRKYGRKCRSIAVSVLGNDQDAEECVNDAYLGVWNAIPPEKPNPFSTFLFRILRNIALNKKRANKRQKRGSVYDEALDEIAETFASSETVESALERKDIQAVLKEFLLSLDKETRGIFVSRYWLMENSRVIAEKTGMKESNVRVKLLRTREKLRVYLEERGIEI
jgi:RNA polymerase sigma-70 factor (ECF subfamily)